MIGRRYLGVDIRDNEIRAVALRREGRRGVLAGGRVIGLPSGVITPSARVAHVRDQARLIAALQELLPPLAGREERVALVLPDSAGRLLLADVETPLRSRQEALQILLWQLKGNFPVPSDEIHLAYQILEQREDGRTRVAVAVMARAIVEQYENLLELAGYHAVDIGFHGLQVYNYYRTRLDRPEETALVIVEGRSFALHYYQGHQLLYQRAREIEAEPAAVYRELSRTLVGATEQFPALRRAGAFVQSDWAECDELLSAVQAAFSRPAMLLEPHLHSVGTVADSLPAARLRGLVGAVGAAEGLM